MELTSFNPQSQHEADFLATFVARSSTLDFFLRQLRLVPFERAANHYLIVAPRGYGKTSLLRRIAIAVRTETDLRDRFIALAFREEQHNVISLDAFWRNCLQSLLEAREDENAPEAEIDELEAAWTEHAPRQALKGDDQDGEPGYREFITRCERLNRRPLLLIDNLDSLLAGLPANQQWSLRRILQADGGPVLIAAASRYPESTHDPKAAFYDFFRVHTLSRLNDEEVMQCLRTRARHRGDAGRVVLDLLDKDPGRIAALNTLAGGNPRTLNVLYGVLESHMSDDVLSQLSAMLDTFTGWYQARTEELPIQARAVFDALALNWDPMLAAALGAVTGLDTTAVSSQLSRLEKSGYVETVALNRRGKGRKGYQVSERFFNIWYLMRNGPRRARQSIKFLTVFLQSCFRISERHVMARDLLDHERTDPGYALALASSLRSSTLRQQLLEYAEVHATRLGKIDEYGAAILELRRNDPRRHELIQQAPLTRPEQTIEELDAVIDRAGDAPEPALRQEVAMALVRKGDALGKLGRPEQAIEAYDTVAKRFGDSPELALRTQVASALVNKCLTLGILGRPEQAIEASDTVVERFGDSPEAALREPVAWALIGKGVLLGILGRLGQAIEAYDTVAKRFGDSPEHALRSQVARALLYKGDALSELGRPEQAIETYDAVAERFGDSPEPALREPVAWALVNKGDALGELGHPEQAIEAYNAVTARFGDSPEQALREQFARALINKGVAHGKLGRPEQAIEAFDSVVERVRDSSAQALREQFAKALINKGVALGKLGRPEQAIEAFDSVVEHFGDTPEPALREAVARALDNKSAALGELGRLQEAEAALHKAIVHDTGDTRGGIWNTLGNLLLDRKGDSIGALSAYHEGLATAPPLGMRAMLHANCAYALALHGGDLPRARDHMQQALADGESFSPPGRHLLEALSCVDDPPAKRWPGIFDHIGQAVSSEDASLWSTYLDDLQRLLWFLITQGQGGPLRRWMDEERYPMRYAPLYHALIAAIDGEDHLLQINPETRQMAARIHEGLAARLKLYPCGG